MYKCQYCGSTQEVDPGTMICSMCHLKLKASAYDRMQTEKMIGKMLNEAGLRRDDARLDYRSEETFRRSLAEARLEDKGESVFAREQEVEARELSLSSYEKEFDEEAPSPRKTGRAAEIEAKKAELAKLKGTGASGAVYALKREIEALEEGK